MSLESKSVSSGFGSHSAWKKLPHFCMLKIDMQKQSKLRSQKAKINCRHILHAANAKAAKSH